VDSASGAQKRVARKQAPPPPPPHEKAGMALKSGHQDSSAILHDDPESTVSHSQAAPTFVSVILPESPIDQFKVTGASEKDRQRLGGGYADRPAVPPPHRPEQGPDRPRPPSTLNPPVPVRGHQRSASTGALINKSLGSLDGSSVAGVPNAGSLSSFDNPDGSWDFRGSHGSVSQIYAVDSLVVVPPDTSYNTAYHFSMHPRSTSPQPPSPGQSQYTKL
ncbi:unnamed protein product, partial [Candidula unifasciata]